MTRHEACVAEAPVGDEFPDVLVKGVKANVEVDSVDQARLGGEGHEPGRVCGGHS